MEVCGEREKTAVDTSGDIGGNDGIKIVSPQEGGFVKEIKWNNEELKAEIAEKMQEYKSLVFTEETMKDAKADRAKLNKLETAFEDERKELKSSCMEPYETFEKQVKKTLR